MKTNHIELTLLASIALMLSACVNEKEFDKPSFDKDEIAIRVGTVQTRAAAEADGLGTFTLGTFSTSDGGSVVLVETVESLDGGMATRGTPAFTENVVDLYGTFNAVAPYNNNGTKKLPDASFQFDGDTFWTHHYAGLGELWPAKYQLFMRMPGDIASGKYGLTSAPQYNTDGSIEFDYQSPTTASNQKDILFTSKTIEANEEQVYFYHVLTGVKFANFYTNAESETRTVSKTKINKVTIRGIKKNGHCKVTPAGTTEGSSATVSIWSNVKDTTSFTQAYADTTNYTVEEGVENYGLDELLNKTASARNLNKPDGSLTFWFIPQTIAEADSVKMTVACSIQHVDKNGNDVGQPKDTTLTVLVGAREWKAGELHTYTLKPIVPGVKITDQLTEYIKKDVKVENTGNVWEYVRVNMIGNWVGKLQTEANVYDTQNTVLNGYTNAEWKDEANKIYKDSVLVEAWNDKDGKTNYGKFTDLVLQSKSNVPAVPGPNSDSLKNYWVRYDKYYYYIKPIGPTDAVTDQMFTQYEVGKSPAFYVADIWGIRRAAKDVHLEMDLMVQAIPAPVDKDGNVLDNEDGEGYIRAWLKALGFEPTKQNYKELLDLKHQ